jgi:hypothetical protein
MPLRHLPSPRRRTADRGAYGWIKGREFPADQPLIDVSQAVPGYPPPRG